MLKLTSSCLKIMFKKNFFSREIFCRERDLNPSLCFDRPPDLPSSSLRNLLSKDPRTNPELDQRLKENAVTMNKMMELRTQLENLSMSKKVPEKFEKLKVVHQKFGASNKICPLKALSSSIRSPTLFDGNELLVKDAQ